MVKKPLVSVIITSRNEADVIGRLLRSVKKQDYKNVETIVVDNNSTDKTAEIARKHTKKVYNFGPERSAQRNYGGKIAKGEFLLFLDADMELSPKVIGECVNEIQNDKKVGAVVIPEISVGRSFWEKVKAFERSFYFDRLDFSIESARFFGKEAFEKSGGYDEEITGTEDWDLSETVRKQGYKIVKISVPIYHHETIPSLASLAKKFFYYGLTAPKTLKKQKTSIISPKTIHFLRPAFYRQWHRLFTHPILTLAMIVMIIIQVISSGVGFLIGKSKNL